VGKKEVGGRNRERSNNPHQAKHVFYQELKRGITQVCCSREEPRRRLFLLQWKMKGYTGDRHFSKRAYLGDLLMLTYTCRSVPCIPLICAISCKSC
jgi:hypothetical protein